MGQSLVVEVLECLFLVLFPERNPSVWCGNHLAQGGNDITELQGRPAGSVTSDGTRGASSENREGQSGSPERHGYATTRDKRARGSAPPPHPWCPRNGKRSGRSVSVRLLGPAQWLHLPRVPIVVAMKTPIRGRNAPADTALPRTVAAVRAPVALETGCALLGLLNDADNSSAWLGARTSSPNDAPIAFGSRATHQEPGR
jgi:hypothetical protein